MTSEGNARGQPTNEPSALQSATSSSLLIGVRRRDAEAWRRLNLLFEPTVRQWCLRAGLQADDAADVAQEVFQAVAAGVDRFRRAQPGDSFRGWICGITQHKIRDYRRRRNKTPDAAGGTEAQLRLADLATDRLASESHSAGDAHGLFRRALELIRAQCEDRTWQAFWRLTVDELTAAEVARELDMSTAAVYVAKSRVLNRLRVELGDVLD